jgi:carbon storage regulator
MLCLSRKKNEAVVLPGLNIRVMVLDIRGDKVRLGFEVPTEYAVHREEVAIAIEREAQRRGDHLGPNGKESA